MKTTAKNVMRVIAIGFKPTKEDTFVLMPSKEESGGEGGNVGDGVGLKVGDRSVTKGVTEACALANNGL
jgi:hypothetical protein